MTAGLTKLVLPIHQPPCVNNVGGSGEPKMSKKKLVSVWTMLVKAMELHKYQIQQVGHDGSLDEGETKGGEHTYSTLDIND